MRKSLLTVLLLSIISFSLRATHFVGGYITYVCVGTNQYEVTVTIYRDCNPGTAGMPGSVGLTLWNAQTGGQAGTYNINVTTGPWPVPVITYDPCTTPPSSICYEVATFTQVIALPVGPALQGYWLTYSSCCRNGTITNLVNPLSQGVRYYCRFADPITYPCNSSPIFNNWPPIVICINVPFVWNHSAYDIDGDSLAYSLCNALGQAGPPTPPWPSVNYASPYTGTYPIASSPAFAINPVTGWISGTPTMVGQWVINVCIEEWRNGIHIGDHHRDIQLNVTDQCSNTSQAVIATNTAGAAIDSIFACGSYTVQFGNLSTSAFTFMWNFGDPATTNDTSSQQYPSYTYPDTGTYLVTLITNPGTNCEDTDQAWATVYPFLVPDFNWTGTMCQYTPVQFNDLSSNQIGTITSWKWLFGDGSNSTLQNPAHVYNTQGLFWVSLIVENSIGCRDTIKKPLQILMAPPVSAGADKTICFGDSLQLNATGNGTWSWSPGPPLLSNATIKNPVAHPVVSTTYTVTLTGFTGCKNKDSINVFVADYPVVNAGPDFMICNSVNGKMAATGSDTSGPLIYSWSPWLTPGGLVPPVPASSIPSNGSKTFVFSALNQHGCQSFDTVIVYRNVIVVNLGADVTMCQGQGYLMNPISANALQTYSWTPSTGLSPSTTVPNPTATPLTTITYTLNVTDTAGCPGSDAIKVTVLQVPFVDAGATDSVCTGNSIGLDASASLGVTYLWDNSDNDVSAPNVQDPIVSPANSKYYYLTVTSANGCSSTDSVWIERLPLPIVQTSADFSICASDSIQLITTGANSYTWAPIGQPGFGCYFCSSPMFYAYVPGVGIGPRNYIVLGTDVHGCSSRDTVRVTVNALPPVNAGPDVFICIDDTTTLVASGAGVGGSYAWTPSPSLSCLNCPSPLAYPPVSETFIVVGTDANGCRSLDKVKVNVFTSSSIFVTADQTICYGQSAPLSAFHPNASNYSWDPDSSVSPATGASVTASPIQTTTYTVTVTDNNNCFQQTTTTVYVNVLPIVVAIPTDVTICRQDSAQLDANGAIGYSWTPATWISNSVIKNPKVSPPNSTIYTVTGTDANGCQNTATVNVTVNQLPPVDAGLDQPICVGDTTQLDASGAIAYLWSPTTGMISTATTEDPFVNPTIQTFYVVEGTDGNGCKNTDAVLIMVNPLPPISAGLDQDICIGSNTTITASGAGTGGVYSWSPSIGLSSTSGATVTANPISTLTYNVLGTDANGCENTDDMILTVNPLPIVTAGSDVTICFKDQTLFSAAGASTYQWDPPTGLSDPYIPNPYASPAGTTVYVVTGTDGNNCVDTDTLTVFVNPLPPVDAGNDVAICFGDTTQLQAVGANSYLWTPPMGLSCVNCDAPVANPSGTVTYAVTGTDLNGCKEIDQVMVTVHPLPLVNAGPDFTIYKGVCIEMHGLGASVYTWSPASYLSDPNISNPMLCATAIDTVTYYLLGIDANNCRNVDSVVARFVGIPDISVPTAFTPNGNGTNDVFKIVKTHNFRLDYMQIFNRWGQVLWQGFDINDGWDGTVNGELQPLGTYVYVIHGSDEFGAPVVTQGNVTLIR